MRDPRGFAIKFYTEDGNWDLVGNNLKVFFIRDATKFPDMVHAFKPDPMTNRQDNGRFFDFIANTPEATNMVTYLFSQWGIPASYRFMEGSGVNTYKWVNQDGRAVLVKYHFEPKQGVKGLTQDEANQIQSTNFNHATQDLYDSIERGDFPEWEMFVQIMSDDEHPELDFDPLDATKIWPREQFPFVPVGKIVLNRNPSNFFAETEQVAFGTGVLVDGLDFSEDKLLVGRTFSYSDTQRYRIGTNYLQLPINKPISCPVFTGQRDGQMAYEQNVAPPPPARIRASTTSLRLLEALSKLSAMARNTSRSSAANLSGRRSTAPMTSRRRAMPTLTCSPKSTGPNSSKTWAVRSPIALKEIARSCIPTSTRRMPSMAVACARRQKGTCDEGGQEREGVRCRDPRHGACRGSASSLTERSTFVTHTSVLKCLATFAWNHALHQRRYAVRIYLGE